MERRFGKATRKYGAWIAEFKDATDFRRWAYRSGFESYASRKEAEEAVERSGAILVKAWYEADLTPEEWAKSSEGKK
jgi:hypothetical protein